MMLDQLANDIMILNFLIIIDVDLVNLTVVLN